MYIYSSVPDFSRELCLGWIWKLETKSRSKYVVWSGKFLRGQNNRFPASFETPLFSNVFPSLFYDFCFSSESTILRQKNRQPMTSSSFPARATFYLWEEYGLCVFRALKKMYFGLPGNFNAHKRVLLIAIKLQKKTRCSTLQTNDVKNNR